MHKEQRCNLHRRAAVKHGLAGSSACVCVTPAAPGTMYSHLIKTHSHLSGTVQLTLQLRSLSMPSLTGYLVSLIMGTWIEVQLSTWKGSGLPFWSRLTH